jgi:putative addiction module CopG family antidote
MDVKLTPEQAQFVDEQIVLSGFEDADAVVAAALQLLEEHYRHSPEFARLKEEVMVGVRQAEAGQVCEVSIEDIIAEGKKRLAKMTKTGTLA